MDAAAALSRCPLFSLLDRIQLARLAGELDELTLAADEVLFRKGDPGDAFYVVRSGQAEGYTGDRPAGAAPAAASPDEVLDFASLRRREGSDLAVLPPLVAAFREQATAEDRLWLHALGQRLAASPHPDEAVAVLLLAGDAPGAAAVMVD